MLPVHLMNFFNLARVHSNFPVSFRATAEDKHLVAMETYRKWLQEYAANITNTSQLNATGYNVTEPTLDSYYHLYVFTGLTLSVFLFGVLRALHMFHIFVTAAQNLHQKMFDCVLRCPILFFDTNPVGKN